MSHGDPNTWQHFAEAASVEHDSEKLMQLVEKLNGALDEQDRKGNRHSKSQPEE